MLALARVGVLVAGFAVEPKQPALVAREMRGHPVEDHAQARRVTAVDKPHKLLRRAEPRGGGIIARDLIPPRTVVGVFHHRQHLDMGVAHIEHIGDQLIRQLLIGQRTAVRIPPPRRGVYLVNIDRAVIDRLPFLFLLPCGVLPLVAVQIVHLGRRARTRLKMIGVGVGLHVHRAVVPRDRIFINVVLRKPRDLAFPDAVPAAGQRMACGVPFVEIADDRHRLGMGRPHTKHMPAARGGMTSHPVIRTKPHVAVNRLFLYHHGMLHENTQSFPRDFYRSLSCSIPPYAVYQTGTY